MRHIKSLSLALLALVMLAGTSFAFVNPPDPDIIAEKKGVSGKKVWEQAAVVLLVRNAHAGLSGTMNILSEDAVIYDTNSDDGVTVRLTTTSADGALAGIAVTAITSSDAATGTAASDDWGRRNWGYILVHGKCTAKAVAGGTNVNAVKDAFMTSTDSGAITSNELFPSSANGILSAYRAAVGSGGFFYDACTTASCEVQVDLE